MHELTAFARHGECFVLADGGESDLDLGNYERYCSLTLTPRLEGG